MEEERRGREFEEFGRVIHSIKNWHTVIMTSAIEEANILVTDESVLKDQHRELAQKLERAKTSANSFVSSAENFLDRANLDQEQEATIKEYYKKGNYEEIKKYITQVQQHFTETQKYYTKFREEFDAANFSCTDMIKACHDKKTDASTKKIGTRVLGGGATLAGVSTMGIALSAVAGVFTFGTGTVIGLAVTGAVTGTAGLSTYYYADNFEKLEEAFKNLGSKFENMSLCITNLEMDMNKIIEELNSADELLKNLSVNHLTTEQGSIMSELECEQFTKCFEYILRSVRGSKLLITNKSMAM